MSSSGPNKRLKTLKKSHCALQWLCVTPARHFGWLTLLLAATLSQKYDRGLTNSQSDFLSMLCRRLRLPRPSNRHVLEVSNVLPLCCPLDDEEPFIAYTVNTQ